MQKFTAISEEPVESEERLQLDEFRGQLRNRAFGYLISSAVGTVSRKMR